MERRKLYIIIAIVLLLVWYLYNNYFMIYIVNNHINVGGIKLGQSLKEVQQITGSSGEQIDLERVYQFGGFRVGVTKGSSVKRVYSITALDPKYQVYNVRVGDSYDEARAKLKKAGFRRSGGYYKKGCIDILATGKNERVDQILIRANDYISLNFLFEIKVD